MAKICPIILACVMLAAPGCRSFDHYDRAEMMLGISIPWAYFPIEFGLKVKAEGRSDQELMRLIAEYLKEAEKNEVRTRTMPSSSTGDDAGLQPSPGRHFDRPDGVRSGEGDSR